MDVTRVKRSANSPYELNVIIEMSWSTDPIKYEFDKKSGALFVDRFLKTPMYYPCNYGFVPHTLSGDGDPIDVLVACDYRLHPCSVILTKPVGVLIMKDESGKDEKIIAVPAESIDKTSDGINSIKDLPSSLIEKIKHFFQHYKDLDSNKWVKIENIEDKEYAYKLITESIQRFTHDT